MSKKLLTPNFGNFNAYFVNSWPTLACSMESWSQKLFLIEQVDNNGFWYSEMNHDQRK